MSSVFVLLLFIYVVIIMEGKALIGDCIIFINRIKLQKVLDLLVEIIGCESECTAFGTH